MIFECCSQLHSIHVTFLRISFVLVLVLVDIFARTLTVKIRLEAIETEMFAADALDVHAAVHLADSEPAFWAAFDFLSFHKTG
jgi:hypothetical protein